MYRIKDTKIYTYKKETEQKKIRHSYLKINSITTKIDIFKQPRRGQNVKRTVLKDKSK